MKSGDEVIIPEPAYPAYAILAQAAQSQDRFSFHVLKNRLTVQAILHRWCVAWEINVDKIKAATTSKTKIIVFSNPTNPTGLVVPKSTILELLNWCEQKGIYLVVDEAYRDYLFDDTFESMLSVVGQSERLIVISSFSKNMAMSGWRIGYLVAHESLIPIFSGMQDALLNCLNNIAQYAAMYAMTRHDLVEELAKKVQMGKMLQSVACNRLWTKGYSLLKNPKAVFSCS